MAKNNNNLLHKGLLVGTIIVLVILFWAYDLKQYLTLENLKNSQEHFARLYATHRLAVIASYMAIYILATALSLPGAVIMTLAGGALFGLLLGTILVSFASTIGATLACFASRFLLRDWVQTRFGDRLEQINAGIAREGAFYLFSLRLVPIFPFFLINLLLGLTRMPLITYYWVSQVGMLPGTLVFVNAGKELAGIQAAGDVMSPGLLGSFALLAIFPLAAKKLLAWNQANKEGKSV